MSEYGIEQPILGWLCGEPKVVRTGARLDLRDEAAMAR
jgi:hypothetical protein